MKLAWYIALALMLIGFAILFRPPRIDETMAPATPAGPTLEPGQHAGIDITVEPGQLEIVLPERIQTRGTFTSGLSQGVLEVTFRPRIAGGIQPGGAVWSANRVLVGEFPPGTYTVVASQVPSPDSKDLFRFEAMARIDARGLCVVDFSDK